MKTHLLSACLGACMALPMAAAAQVSAPSQQAAKITSQAATNNQQATAAANTIEAESAKATSGELINAVTAPPPTPPNDRAAQNLLRNTQDLIKSTPNGEINWTGQHATAKGLALIDKSQYPNPAQAKAMATAAAITDAQRNLLETIKTIYVVGDSRLKDIMAESEVISNRVNAVLKSAEMIGGAAENNGRMEVTMRLHLYQTNGLAPVFYKEETNLATARLGNRTDDLAGSLVEAAAVATPKLALNLNGQKYEPALFPVLVDETSALVFDISKLYDPSRGKFPVLVNVSRNAYGNAGFQDDMVLIDIARTTPGKLTVDNDTKEKINLNGNAAKTMLDMGKLMLVLY